MTTVFIAGSITIRDLDARVSSRIDKIVDSGFDIVVGDAGGADCAVQRHLVECEARGVTVFCTGPTPRNNLGDWSTRSVGTSHAPGTRAFFTAKDLRMAEVADYGLMIWDLQSTGTLGNVIELLGRQKKSVVYVQASKVFKTIGNVVELENLVSSMSDQARQKAESKMCLSSRIQGLRQVQSPIFA